MADEAGYLLSEFDAAWVVANAGKGKTGLLASTPASGLNVILCKNGANSIAGRSGSSLSSRSCTVYSAVGGLLSSTPQTVNVYNLSTQAIAAEAYLIAARVGGVWIAVWEDC